MEDVIGRQGLYLGEIVWKKMGWWRKLKRVKSELILKILVQKANVIPPPTPFLVDI